MSLTPHTSTSSTIRVVLSALYLCIASAQPYRFADFLESEVTDVADVPLPCPAHSDWLQTDAILAQHWSPADGFDGNGDGGEYTYGEVTNLGARQLAHEMQIASPSTETNSVVFYDLGSGVGRLAVQIALDNGNAMKKSVGVELSKGRHDTAMTALSRIKQQSDVPIDLSGIEFVHADALKYDFTDATHIFISSLCFPRSVLESLQDILVHIEGLTVVAALNRLDSLESSTNWIRSDASVQMTWGPGSAKIYKRRRR